MLHPFSEKDMEVMGPACPANFATFCIQQNGSGWPSKMPTDSATSQALAGRNLPQPGCGNSSAAGEAQAHLLLADLPHADHGVLAAGAQNDAVGVERRRCDAAVHLWVRHLCRCTVAASSKGCRRMWVPGLNRHWLQVRPQHQQMPTLGSRQADQEHEYNGS